LAGHRCRALIAGEHDPRPRKVGTCERVTVAPVREIEQVTSSWHSHLLA
jgi:hypothetical protein